MKIYEDRIALDSRYSLALQIHHLKPRSAKPYFHWHHQLEISFAKSGRAEYMIGDKMYDVREGDIFIFNSLEPHAMGVREGDEITNMVVRFDPEFVWSIENNLFDVRYLKVFFGRDDGFSNKLEQSHPSAQEIRRLLLEMEEESRRKSSEYDLMVKIKLLNVLVCLIRYYGYPRNGQEPKFVRKQAIARMNQIADYIDRHLHEEIRLESLAGLVHMNTSYFSVFFKKYTGLSPSEYIMKKRIYRSIEYLRATDKTILEIAGLCGFNNVSNFNKAFKKVTNKKPSDFRTEAVRSRQRDETKIVFADRHTSSLK